MKVLSNVRSGLKRLERASPFRIRDSSESHAENVARLFRRDVQPLLDRVAPAADGARKNILLWTPLAPWPHMFLEFSILTHLRLRGHTVMAAICDGNLPHCEMERANFPRPSCVSCSHRAHTITDAFALPRKGLSYYVPAAEIRAVYDSVQTLSAEQLQAYEYKGIDIGAFATRYLATYYQGFVRAADVVETTRRILAGELLATLYAERLYMDTRPDMVFMLSGNLCQYYGAFRVLRGLGANIVTWDESAQWADGFYMVHNAHAGDVPLDEVWPRHRDRPLSESEESELTRYYADLRSGSVTDRQYHPNPDKDVRRLRERLGLEGGRRIFVAFPNVVWDSNVLTKNVGFPSMVNWLRTLVDWFAAHPDDILLLRAHPGEKRIPLKEYQTSEGSTLPNLLAAEYPHGLPGNVKVIPADDDAYSYSLGDLAAGIGVYTSNIGLELALCGRKVWLAGDAIYRGKGFTVDLESADHLRSMLEQKQWDATLGAGSELPKRFAHLWIFRDVVRLPYLKRVDTGYPEVVFKDLCFLRPGNDPALDAIAARFLDGRPFIDIPSRTDAIWKRRGQRTWTRARRPVSSTVN